MKFLPAFFIAMALAVPASASPLIEPHMRIKPSRERDGKVVALTFDACTGKADERILQTLIEHKIASTIFVTARWLKCNPQAIADMKSHPELFEIENHGAKHLPAVDVPMDVFGIKAAGSPQAVKTEVENGAAAVKATFGKDPTWYRGAAAQYNQSAINLISKLNFNVAGFSLAGDGGASFSEKRAAQTIGNAKSGDVIIAHINQPLKPAGAGVVEGILKLQSEGFVFLKLNEAF